ncbi:1-acyl-sn-glycerol-3-phosphate acyltransferase [Dethiosulfovibrio sp. F2B]|uniref:lysophospholipid acyltransferase family protein n=1 Tax=Dethiosulfovibrio faecalis TaxID=2720018 RepID=UPI001F2B79DA|nr:lysophospholipid acyltransferase family protein [Dethiosulfovibrio faecalis]MCF4150322.1 1-acyl-sn-glycerol-3-phosphate acyltransferase [Dethiosulfovibrio faecalis]
MKVEGKDKIPVERPFIMVANHCSNLDPVVLGAAFPDRLRYLAKVELFEGSRLFALLIRTLGAIPVSRDSSLSAGGALRTFLQLLEGGESVLLFPEGARSLDGRLKELEGGVALLAVRTGVPIVPAYISGTFDAMPVGANKIGWNSIEVRFGDSIDPSKMLEDGMSSKECRSLILSELDKSLKSMEAVALGG